MSLPANLYLFIVYPGRKRHISVDEYLIETNAAENRRKKRYQGFVGCATKKQSAEKHSAEKHTAHKHSAEKHTAKRQLGKISIQQKSIQ